MTKMMEKRKIKMKRRMISPKEEDIIEESLNAKFA